MKILVTGATGFVGRHLVEALLKRGEKVACLVRSKEKKFPFDKKKVEIKLGDLRVLGSLREALREIDIVYHLAAISGKSATAEDLYQRVNVEGTRNILEAAKKAKVKRFIFVSSAAVTGRLMHVPGSEVSPYGPTNGYERSKVGCEKLVLEAIERDHFPAVIIRPGSIYGPRNIGSNMANFLKMAAKGFCILPGNGKNFWDMVYISDAVDGLILAGVKEKAVGETFILTGSKPVRVDDIIKFCAKAGGKKLKTLYLPVVPMKLVGKSFGLIESLIHVPMPFSEKSVQILSESRYHSGEKARKILGFKPKVAIEKGIVKTIAWYKEVGCIK